MKSPIHILILFTFSISILFFSGCDSTTSSIVEEKIDGSEVAISIRYDKNSPFASIAKYADILVYAEDMDSILTPLTIDSGSIFGTIKNVPAGFNRTLEMGVYDKKYELQYFGSTKVTVEKGKSVYAKIDLYRVDSTGTIIVEGVIIDSTINDTTLIDTFSYDEIKALLVAMSDTAGVDYMKVMDYLGEDYLEKTVFTSNNIDDFIQKVNDAIFYILNGNDTTKTDLVTYDEMKLLLYNLSSMLDVNYIEVMDSLQDYMDPQKDYSLNDVPSFTVSVIDYILIIKNEYSKTELNYDEMKTILYALSILMDVSDSDLYDKLYDEYLKNQTLPRNLLTTYIIDIINTAEILKK